MMKQNIKIVVSANCASSYAGSHARSHTGGGESPVMTVVGNLKLKDHNFDRKFAPEAAIKSGLESIRRVRITRIPQLLRL